MISNSYFSHLYQQIGGQVITFDGGLSCKVCAVRLENIQVKTWIWLFCQVYFGVCLYIFRYVSCFTPSYRLFREIFCVLQLCTFWLHKYEEQCTQRYFSNFLSWLSKNLFSKYCWRATDQHVCVYCVQWRVWTFWN